jgi:ATP-binding cassette subfamily C protein LapB
MKDIFSRLFSAPIISLELMVASLCANALALAAPIFVIQVLNRYVTFGVDTTLATLASGAVAAVIFEFGFRRTRLRLAERLGEPIESRDAQQGLSVLAKSKLSVFQLLSPHARNQAATGGEQLRNAYSAGNLVAIIDMPFAMLFLAVLAMLNIYLAAIAAVFAVLTLMLGFSTIWSLRNAVREQQQSTGRRSGIVSAALGAGETVRVFDNAGMLQQIWDNATTGIRSAQERIGRHQDIVQTGIQSLQGLMTIAMISAGALMVVAGTLDIGALIGANILASRALGPLAKFGSLARTLATARETRTIFDELSNVPLNRMEGRVISDYTGGVAFDDVTFAYSGSRSPLVEALSVDLKSGQTLAITGPNGSGKSTLAQLIVGVREPMRGRVLADGVDLLQLQPVWWRRQVSYLPQEPFFLPGTVQDNFRAANPDIDKDRIEALIGQVGLRAFIDESSEGIDSRIADGGRELALGIRRRLALARALAVGGKLMIVDEPTEGLDEQGRNLVYAVMNQHAANGGTIVACSHDPQILKGADWVIDLAFKPKPRLTNLASAKAARITASDPRAEA